MNNIGAFQIARQIFESELWLRKPSSWTKIWIYILGKVNHTDSKKFKRGENYFNFTNEIRLIGNDITLNNIKRFLQFARSTDTSPMIRTERSTRGMIIKVNNYDRFQTLGNYSRTPSVPSHARATHEPRTPIIEECKNDKNVINSKQSLRTNDVNKIMDEFYQINPTLNWGNKTQRKAAEDLLSKYPLETLIGMLTWYKKQMTDKFCPVATTPLAFKNKLGDIKAYADKLKSNSLVTNIKI